MATTLTSSRNTSSLAPFPSALIPTQPLRKVGGLIGRGSRKVQLGGKGPSGRGQKQVGKGQDRVYALTRQDAQVSNVGVAGTFSTCLVEAHVLFDPRIMHYFMPLFFSS